MGASSLHLLNPTGLQVQLKQSIVKKDAFLPRSVSLSLSLSLSPTQFRISLSLLSRSVRIEGDIPGFEVTVSDEKVVTILKVVTSLQLPPPSLANTTTYYDTIPVTVATHQYCSNTCVVGQPGVGWDRSV